MKAAVFFAVIVGTLLGSCSPVFAAISEQEFNNVIHEFTQRFGPWVRQSHHEIKVNAYWDRELKPANERGSGGATPYRDERTWGVNVSGGKGRKNKTGLPNLTLRTSGKTGMAVS